MTGGSRRQVVNMVATTPLDEAERLGMIGSKLAQDVRGQMAADGRAASDILSETGGEPLSPRMLELIEFLRGRETADV